ncbi:MAG: hypothetical protein ACKO0Z_25095 [Betaproteobacteria bacterium]
MIYEQDGKTWRLPDSVPFEMPGGYGWEGRRYTVLGYRTPKAGEHYLSGAIVQAWKAPRNMGERFLVVSPLPAKSRRGRFNWG